MTNRPTAEQALEWLAIQTERLNEIRNASTRDAGFREWRQTTLTILQRIWPGQAARAQRFRRVPFAPPSTRASEQEARECYERGIAETKKLLKMWETELKNVGTSGFESQPVPDLRPAAPIGHVDRAPDVPSIDLSSRPRPANPPKAKSKSKQRLGDMLGFGDWPREVRSEAEATSTPEPKPIRRAPAKPGAAQPRPAARPANHTPPTNASQPKQVARPANHTPPTTASQPRLVSRPPNTAPPTTAAPSRSATRPATGPALVPRSVPAAATPPEPSSTAPVAPSEAAPVSHERSAPPPSARPAPSSDGLGRSIQVAIEHSRTPEPLEGGLEIQPGFEGPIAPEHPSMSPSNVRLSTSLGSSPSEVPPPGRDLIALNAELERLGVPGGDLTRVGLGLAEMAARLDSGLIPWESMRETIALVMPFPGLARRVVPLLLRHFDAAA